MLKNLLEQVYSLIYRPNLYQGKKVYYNFEFPDKKVKKIPGRSPRNAFDNWKYNKIISGKPVNLNYLDVKYLS